uniref:Secreted protein n=1 Tax=Haemonchus placei TaxID=6290 RepID=A0A0N4X8B7_HAEPC
LVIWIEADFFSCATVFVDRPNQPIGRSVGGDPLQPASWKGPQIHMGDCGPGRSGGSCDRMEASGQRECFVRVCLCYMFVRVFACHVLVAVCPRQSLSFPLYVPVRPRLNTSVRVLSCPRLSVRTHLCVLSVHVLLGASAQTSTCSPVLYMSVSVCQSVCLCTVHVCSCLSVCVRLSVCLQDCWRVSTLPFFLSVFLKC